MQMSQMLFVQMEKIVPKVKLVARLLEGMGVVQVVMQCAVDMDVVRKIQLAVMTVNTAALVHTPVTSTTQECASFLEVIC